MTGLLQGGRPLVLLQKCLRFQQSISPAILTRMLAVIIAGMTLTITVIIIIILIVRTTKTSGGFGCPALPAQSGIQSSV